MPETLMDRSLGELACAVAGATAVLSRHRLDFCCGGAQTLRAAAADRGLDPATVAAELVELQRRPARSERDWRQARAAELIDHILQRFHERHREQLPELIRLAQRVESVHADSPDCPRGLTAHLMAMQQDLENHMLKEERILFPLLRNGSPAFVPGPIAVMRQEHDQHGDALRQLLELTGGSLLAPAGACATWQALMSGLQTLHEDLMQHIHLENNVLFAGLAAGAAAGDRPARSEGGGCCGACGGG
ncbi:MAG: iron-sulfur cluster repair protein YtfE [Burkholderiales bacterium]|nr:iron-sulfur cluster repair protein YtfE [Burkholderiales bacterium]MBP7521751.1 iron-sulfur cluster repair protein YtfE [Leptothrix sp. (in: b-proteobacteria)]HQY09134.1 iron-sulfur cluster repair protein YtfE [Burkholderiaceae bacterium]